MESGPQSFTPLEMQLATFFSVISLLSVLTVVQGRDAPPMNHVGKRMLASPLAFLIENSRPTYSVHFRPWTGSLWLYQYFVSDRCFSFATSLHVLSVSPPLPLYTRAFTLTLYRGATTNPNKYARKKFRSHSVNAHCNLTTNSNPICRQSVSITCKRLGFLFYFLLPAQPVTCV